MNADLKKKILMSYKKHDWFFYNPDLYKNISFLLPMDNVDSTFPYVEPSSFDDIISWYHDDDIFNHLFPAILMNCVENDFLESKVTLCLMEKLEPSFLNFGDCSYFYEMSYFNAKQRSVFNEFIIDFKKNNVSHNDECKKTSEALDWLKKRDDLIEDIFHVFSTEERLFYKDIADSDDVDGKNLCENLNDLNWKEVDEKSLNIIIEDYNLLYDKAFFYFIPACMVNTLINLFKERSDIPFYTIRNLCRDIKNEYFVKKYSFFHPQHKVITARFLNLILELGRCEKLGRSDIEMSLKNIWLKDIY